MIKHLILLKIENIMDINQSGLASMVSKLFDKKTSGGTTKDENMSNKKLAEELHKQIIRKLKK